MGQMRPRDSRRAWRRARTWIWIVVPLAVGWLAFAHRDALVEAAGLIRQARLWWIAAGAGAIALVYLCRACVYAVPLGLFGYPAGRPFLWAVALTATAMHQLFPSGGASGYAFLAYAMTRRGVPAGQASLVALIDTLSYAAAVATLVVASLVDFAIGGVLHVPGLGLFFGAGLVIVALAAWIYVLQRDQRRFTGLVVRLTRRAGAWLGRHWRDEPVLRFLHEYYEGKRIIARRPAAFARMLAFQYLAIACDGAALYAVFLALGAAPDPWTVLMGFVVAMSGVAFIGVPGGGGSFEAIMSAFFAGRGVPVSQAIAAALLYRVVAFWLPVLASLIVLFRFRRRRRTAAPATRSSPARHARGRP
jgi:uncharacterized protein (TIRG00374 family)